jgi:hypothetical protein
LLRLMISTYPYPIHHPWGTHGSGNYSLRCLNCASRVSTGCTTNRAPGDTQIHMHQDTD